MRRSSALKLNKDVMRLFETEISDKISRVFNCDISVYFGMISNNHTYLGAGVTKGAFRQDFH